MTVGIVAKLKVAAGKNAEFEAVFAEMARGTHSSEPGCNFYALHKSKTDPQLYVVLEQYKDMAAIKAHQESAHFKAGFAKMGPLLGGAPEIELLDGV